MALLSHLRLQRVLSPFLNFGVHMNPSPVRHNKTMERSALLVCTLSSFLAPFMISAVNVAMPAMQADLNIKAVELGWVATIYLLAMAVTLVPMGKIADMYGLKKIFTIGLVIYTLASTLAAFVPNTAILLVFRAGQGVGSGMFVSTGMAILTSIFPPERRGRVIGMYVAAVYIGLSVGPFAGGLMTEHLGWRSIFLLMFPLGIASVALTIINLQGEWAGSSRQPFNLTGTLLYAVSICSLAYGASIMTSALGVCLVVLGVAGGVVFFLHQYRSPYPVLDVRLFTHNHTFTFSSMAALLNYSASFAITFLMSLYLQYIQGMSPQAAGTLLVAQPLVMALGSPLVGRLSEQVEARWLATAGMLITTLGILCYTQLDLDTPRQWILANLILLGTGFALFSSPNTSAIMGAVDKSQYGVASGVVAIMRLLGQMLSMAMATVVLALMLGNVVITPSLYPRFLESIRTVFYCSAALCALGACFSLARGRTISVPQDRRFGRRTDGKEKPPTNP